MVVLNQANTTDNIIVTVEEKRSIVAANYLFVFEHVTTKEQVKKIFLAGSDVSLYPTRYNEFEVPTSVLFLNATPGQYNYFIYEQDSSSNLDSTGLALVEMGKAILKTTAFNYTGYEATTAFKGYKG